MIFTSWVTISVLLSPKHRFRRLKNSTVILIAFGWPSLKFFAVIRSNTHPINLFCRIILTISGLRRGLCTKNFDKNSITFCVFINSFECDGLSVSSLKLLQMLIINSVTDSTRGLNFLAATISLKKFYSYWYTIYFTFLFVHISTNILLENMSRSV